MPENRPEPGGDPQATNWGGPAWSDWHQLDATLGLVPQKATIYRLGCQGRPELIYVGISERLRSRLGGLRLARKRPPDFRGHSAAPCVVDHEKRGEVVEVSWALVGDMDRRDLMGLEVDLIAACRARYGESPACQFHGRPLE